MATAAGEDGGPLVFGGVINKSPSDPRSYRALTLSNGLNVLIVQDPVADGAAAALDVHVGHFSDPSDLPGLAHFCEHMLFLGTKSYPEEGSYMSFLSQNGGSSNAFTGNEDTCYFFDIALPSAKEAFSKTKASALAKGRDEGTASVMATGAFEAATRVGQAKLFGSGGALDRFSSFFKDPLFTPSGAGREINAVDSEHRKNVQQDFWRLGQLSKASYFLPHYKPTLTNQP